jgi:hypothetical protein
MIFWLVLKLEKSEKCIVHSPHQTQLKNAPTPERRKGGSYTPCCNFSLVAWNYILKIGCHYFWPRLIALHKNTLTIELKIKTQRYGLTQNLHWVLILVNPVTWGALLTGLSNTGTIFRSGLVCLARKAFGFSPSSSLGWAYPPVVDFWALVRVKPTASGFTDQVFLILARLTPSRLCLPYFKAFGFSLSNLPWAHGAIPQM